MYNNLLSIIIVCIFILPGDLNNVMAVLRCDLEIKTEFILSHRSINTPQCPHVSQAYIYVMQSRILVQLASKIFCMTLLNLIARMAGLWISRRNRVTCCRERSTSALQYKSKSIQAQGSVCPPTLIHTLTSNRISPNISNKKPPQKHWR